ncbi:MAG: type 4a pilus biogenesis protein PilO [Candidatus Omnitrophica bacterium]|nr:type 4a pilus biogenesis protein PilO [Candidatus Omnitrophota bacterium]
MFEKLANFKKLTTREKILVIGLVLVVGVNLYIQLIHKPISKRLKNYRFQLLKTKGKLEELESKLPDLRKQKDDINSMKVEFKKMEEHIKEMERTLPGRGQTTQFLKELTREASGLNIELTSIRQKVERYGDYSRLFVELKFNASYGDIVNYIRNLESISPYLAVEKMEVSEPKKMEEKSTVQLALSVLLGEAYLPESFKAPPEGPPVKVSRDIFISSRGPVSSAKIQVSELKLMGVTWRGERSTAIINNEVVRVGDKVGNLRVKQILLESVTLTDGREDFVLSIER